ncbi:hypothetical protein SAMN05421770_107269 [Granulicella rosea]|uniref:Uncharacterized protein n=1 Tax=Granulicella rosea TaxID=474952 RepID=A0A239LUF5_9BACT|nr:hypothetical protein SAMN05421770_107269 [Granulicella rosea]
MRRTQPKVVILSAAKDLLFVQGRTNVRTASNEQQILRFAQDDNPKGES